MKLLKEEVDKSLIMLTSAIQSGRISFGDLQDVIRECRYAGYLHKYDYEDSETFVESHIYHLDDFNRFYNILIRMYDNKVDPGDDYMAMDEYGNMKSVSEEEAYEDLKSNAEEIAEVIIDLYDRGSIDVSDDNEILSYLDMADTYIDDEEYDLID